MRRSVDHLFGVYLKDLVYQKAEGMVQYMMKKLLFLIFSFVI